MPKECPKCHSENPDASSFCPDCGTRLTPADEPAADRTWTATRPAGDLKRGQVFAGRYEIIERLGRGGMGHVYRAEDRTVHQEVALKVISPEIVADASVLERFRNELRLARQVAHRNICRMFDLGEADGVHFITMEYVQGENLKSMIRMSGQLGVATAVGLARQVGEGLAEAHRMGVIHRDLKPSNIMVDKEGTARIMDFGVARSLKMPGITQTGGVVGTPEYMSPEQLDGEQTDPRSDIYALGVILYEMVTGRAPFAGETPYAVAMKHKTEVPAPPRSLNPHLPAVFERVIMTCLEKDRERRYRSAEALLADLDAVARELPAGEGRKTGRRIKPRPGAKKSWPLTVPGMIGLALALVVAGYILSTRLLRPKGPPPAVQAAPAKLIAVLPFDDISPDKSNAYFSAGLADEIIADLSRIGSLRVFSRTSALVLKSTLKDVQAMGREHGIDYVLEGSVRKADRDIRLTVQLTDTANGTQIWGDQYGGTVDDIFEIQERLARSVVDALQLKLTAAETAGITSRPLANVPAYDFYLKARQEIWRWDEEGLKRALEFLQAGLDIAGPNVLLYAGMGYVYWQYYNTGLSQDPASLERVKDYAERIFALEPDSSYGHLLLGLVETMSDNQKSVKHLKRVLDLDPNNPDALYWLTAVYSHVGKTEAAAPLVERLLKIDPFNPLNHSMPGWLLFFNGQFAAALEPFQRMYAMLPDNPASRGLYAIVLIYNRRQEEAFGLIDQLAGGQSPHVLGRLGLFWKFALQGKKPEALAEVTPELRAVAGRDITFSWLTATGFAILGDKDQALDWLETAVRLGFINYPYLARIDPFLEPLRGDPRFVRLIDKVRRAWEKFET